MKSFKTRVKDILIHCSKIYSENFLNTEYFIYSENFKEQQFYTIVAKSDNFLHLTGVQTALKATEFFNKCFDGSLLESDFELGSATNKGSIRRKISVLENACRIFEYPELIQIEEKFIRNKISCVFSSSDSECTLGFCLTKNSKPQTLLKGNQLNNPIEIDLIMKKSDLNKNFDIILINRLNEPAFNCAKNLLATYNP